MQSFCLQDAKFSAPPFALAWPTVFQELVQRFTSIFFVGLPCAAAATLCASTVIIPDAPGAIAAGGPQTVSSSGTGQ